MTLEARIAELAQAVGADIRALQSALSALPPPAPPTPEDEIVDRAVKKTLAVLGRIALAEALASPDKEQA